MKIDFEDYLKDKHAEQYTGLDDEMPDDFDNWLVNLEPDEWIEFGQDFKELNL